jgi:muramidase (phage lysozyme)/prefoldin subunit 5
VATVIDQLIVTLGLDAKDFTKGQKESAEALLKTKNEAEKASKRMQEEAKKAAEQYKKVRNEVLGLVAALLSASAVKSFVEKVTDSDRAVGRLSKNLDISVKSLSAWKGVAERLGDTGADIESAFRNTNKIVQDMKLNGQGSEYLIPLQRAGVDIAKFLDDTTSAEDRMKMLSEALSKLKPKDAQSFGQAAGYSEDTINVLMHGRGVLEQMLKDQEKINVTTEEDVRNAEKRGEAWTRLKQRIERVGNNILNDVTPSIDEATKALDKFFTYLEKHTGVAEVLVGAVATAFGALGAIKFVGLISRIAGVTAATKEASAAASGWGSKLGGIAGWLSKRFLVAEVVHEGLSAVDPKDKAGMWVDAKVPGYSVFENFMSKLGFGRSYQEQVDAANAANMPAPARAIEEVNKQKAAAITIANSAFGALIAKGEGDYNSVNLGKAGGYKSGTRDLGNMTVAEVIAAQKAHQFNAVGRYQLIGNTLSDAVKTLGLSGSEKFDKTTQDRIFEEYLVKNKYRAIGDYLSGKSNNLNAAIHAAAQAWASVADPSTGKSLYEGIGNNHASISVAQMAMAMQNTRGSLGGGSTTTNDVSINNINVQTQATDSTGIAKTIKQAIELYAFTGSANYGMM